MMNSKIRRVINLICFVLLDAILIYMIKENNLSEYGFNHPTSFELIFLFLLTALCLVAIEFHRNHIELQKNNDEKTKIIEELIALIRETEKRD